MYFEVDNSYSSAAIVTTQSGVRLTRYATGCKTCTTIRVAVCSVLSRKSEEVI